LTNVEIKIEILNWAIQQSDIPKDNLIDKYPIIEKWINGDKKPTFKQLLKFSDWLKIPFGLLFLQEVPKDNEMNAEFRTINQKLHSSFSKNLRDTLLEMERRQLWMSEYSIRNQLDTINWDINIDYKDDPQIVAAKLRSFFDLDDFWQSKIKTQYEHFKFLRDIIEAEGVLVMMNGIVGNNTHRKLDIEEFRAFALSDRYAPLIFINRNDTVSGMIFSIVHEMIHLIIEDDQDDVLIESDIVEKERLINAFTAEFLVPSNIIKDEFNITENIFYEVDRLCRLFNVSSSVIGIKLYKLGLIDNEVKDEIINDANKYFLESKNIRENKSVGGNFYSTTASRISKTFYNTVIHQVEAGNIQFTEAYRLLNLKGKTYDGFKSYVDNKLYE